MKTGVLETLPINGLVKLSGAPPKNAVAFTGCAHPHPSEKNKMLLVYDPLGVNPSLMEFNVADILFVEDIPSVVTEDGEGIPLVKIWVRRGARGVLLEPFEVQDPIQFVNRTGNRMGRLLIE
ncbi:MAG: hypothetical protein LBI67_01205 [Treponema sp.]|jgi:hypothetical protein|nr:hypothetical protein [Treponema sp.]